MKNGAPANPGSIRQPRALARTRFSGMVSTMTPQPLLIGGQRVTAPQTQRAHNPYNGELSSVFCVAGPDEIALALAAADTAFATTRRQAAFTRARILQRAAELIREHAAELANLVMMEAGKPISLAESEVARCVLTFEFAAAEVLTQSAAGVNLAASAVGQNHEGYVHRFPLGIILAITPFNFPINLVAHKLAPAIATGNTVLLKPSPRTPLIALRLVELLQEAGIVPGQVNCVQFDPALVPSVLADPRVKMLSFTGSAAVGWKLKSQAVKQKVTLELGGNAAAIVHGDADWPKSIPTLAGNAFNYAGQACISLQRLYVERTIFEEFKTAFVAHVRTNVKHGNPADRSAIVGPMIDLTARDRVLAWVDEALKAGAKLLTDLRVGKDDTVIPAIVVEGLPGGVKLTCEEVFGPVVALEPYDTFEEALAKVNDSPYGLQAGVFTKDLGRIYQAFRALEVGAVMINQGPTFRPENLPYGGVKDSGHGREGLRNAMEEMTEPRALVINLG